MLLLYQYAVMQSYDEALTRSMVFIELLAANIFLTLINRSLCHSVLTTLHYTNRLVPMIIGITALLSTLIFPIPSVTRFFSLGTLNLKQLLIIISVVFVVTVWYEGVKFYNKKGLISNPNDLTNRSEILISGAFRHRKRGEMSWFV